MPFKAQLNFPEIVFGLSGSNAPMRAYVHESWTREVAGELEQAAVKLIQARKDLPLREYSLATLWADKDEKEMTRENMDFFLFSNMDPWPGDLHIEVYSILGDQYGDTIRNPATMRGDTVMMLGIEETYRRQCESLKQYTNNSPNVHIPTPGHLNWVPKFIKKEGKWIPTA
jgi:hypothetical protein